MRPGLRDRHQWQRMRRWFRTKLKCYKFTYMAEKVHYSRKIPLQPTWTILYKTPSVKIVSVCRTQVIIVRLKIKNLRRTQ